MATTIDTTSRRERIADGVIAAYAQEDLELRERIAVLELERDSYRELAQAAIAQLADAHTASRRQDARIRHLIAEVRDTRQTMQDTGAQLRAAEGRAAA